MATTHILATGKIVGANEMDAAIPPFMLTKHVYVEYLCSLAEDESAASLQRMDDEPMSDGWEPTGQQATTDYAAELQELEDDMEDRTFWASGAW